MNFNAGISISVKFRAFGITFGTVNENFTLGFDLATKKISVQTLAAPAPANATQVLNQRGVVIQAWLL